LVGKVVEEGVVGKMVVIVVEVRRWRRH